jgi:DNA-directed RNA polymerase sigma subunit (sigma70/sigma32)
MKQTLNVDNPDYLAESKYPHKTDGMSIAEIGRHLGISRQSVGQILDRAILKLRRHVENDNKLKEALNDMLR